MGCGASTALMPAQPPAGSGFAVIKHRKLMSTKTPMSTNLQKQTSIDSGASTQLSEDAKQYSILELASLVDATPIEELARAFDELPETVRARLNGCLAHFQLVEYVDTASTATDAEIADAFHGIDAWQSMRLLAALGASSATVSGALGAEARRSMGAQHIEDVTATLDKVGPTERGRLRQGLAKLQLDELAREVSGVGQADVTAALDSVGAAQRQVLLSVVAPAVLEDYAKSVTSMSSQALQILFDDVPQEERQRLASCAVQVQLAEYVGHMPGASEDELSLALCGVSATEKMRLVAAVESLEAVKEESKAEEPPSLQDYVQLASMATVSELASAFSGVERNACERLAACAASLDFAKSAAAAATASDSQVQVVLGRVSNTQVEHFVEQVPASSVAQIKCALDGVEVQQRWRMFAALGGHPTLKQLTAEVQHVSADQLTEALFGVEATQRARLAAALGSKGGICSLQELSQDVALATPAELRAALQGVDAAQQARLMAFCARCTKIPSLQELVQDVATATPAELSAALMGVGAPEKERLMEALGAAVGFPTEEIHSLEQLVQDAVHTSMEDLSTALRGVCEPQRQRLRRELVQQELAEAGQAVAAATPQELELFVQSLPAAERTRLASVLAAEQLQHFAESPFTAELQHERDVLYKALAACA